MAKYIRLFFDLLWKLINSQLLCHISVRPKIIELRSGAKALLQNKILAEVTSTIKFLLPEPTNLLHYIFLVLTSKNSVN